MNTLVWVMLITLISGVGGTGLGGLVSAFIRKDSKRIVSLLLSFAAGVMLAVVCFDLLSDALHEPELAGSVAWSLLGIALGYAVVALLNHLIDQNTNHEVEHIDPDHPKTADDLDELIHSDHFEEHKKEHNNLFVAGIIMAAAIALHNLPEGMVIGSAYAGADATSLITGGGFLIAVVIGLHNIPEGMALRPAHRHRRAAGLLAGLHGPAVAHPLPRLCQRRHALRGLWRAAARVHPDVALQNALLRRHHRHLGRHFHHLCLIPDKKRLRTPHFFGYPELFYRFNSSSLRSTSSGLP